MLNPQKTLRMLIKKLAKPNHLFGLPFITSLLLIIIFAETSLSWLVFVALIPLLYFFNIADKKSVPTKRVVLTVWASGYVFFLFNQLWMFFIDPSSWASVQGPVAQTAVVFCWLYVSFIYSLGFLIFGWLITRHSKIPRNKFAIILIPAAWIVSEVSRSLLFSILTWGKEATLGAHWNFANLGFAAIATPLGFASRLVGLYGLSFLVVCLNIAVLKLVQKKYRTFLVVVTLASFLSLLGAHNFNSEQTPIPVALVQLKDYSSNYGLELLAQIKQEPTSSPPVLLVLPEESQFYSLPDPERQAINQAVFSGGKGHVITTAFENTNSGKLSPVIQYYDEKDALVSSQRKTFLIPVGEYLPLILETLMAVTGNSDQIGSYKEQRLHARGTSPEEPVDINGLNVGALACSGVLSPSIYQNMTKKGAEVLVNSAALDIFSETNIYYEQAKQIARFQAVANARPFIHSAMGGDSYIIGAGGNFMAESKPRQLSYMTASIVPSDKMTIYSHIGEVFAPLGILITGIGIAYKKRLA